MKTLSTDVKPASKYASSFDHNSYDIKPSASSSTSSSANDIIDIIDHRHLQRSAEAQIVMMFDEPESSRHSSNRMIIEDAPKVVSPFAKQTPTPTKMGNNNATTKVTAGGTKYTTYENDEAQKKFANAKAISSDQYFNKEATSFERSANMAKFQGSSSISSADYFGDGNGGGNGRNGGGGRGSELIVVGGVFFMVVNNRFL